MKDAKLKESIADAALGQNFIAESPLVIVGCTDSRISSRYGEGRVSLHHSGRGGQYYGDDAGGT